MTWTSADSAARDSDAESDARVLRLSEGEALAQEGMDAAVNAADLKWLRMARWTIEQYAARRAEFTADDILIFLAGLNVHTSEPRALGGVMRAARLDGLIEATGQYRKASRPQAHARPQMVWRGKEQP